MRGIDVFLMFTEKERSTEIVDDITKRKAFDIPKWDLLTSGAWNRGYALTVSGPSRTPSSKNIQDSMRDAEVTLLVGHGQNPDPIHGSKWVTDRIILSDGLIKNSEGIVVGKWAVHDGQTKPERTDPFRSVGPIDPDQ
jgi:hypothetical protein